MNEFVSVLSLPTTRGQQQRCRPNLSYLVVSRLAEIMEREDTSNGCREMNEGTNEWLSFVCTAAFA